jgi:uncharacterized membrane protein (UPF0182 family)
MMPISLPKTDLNEVPEAQRVFVLQRQLVVLKNQLEQALRMIEPSDITISDGVTLQDFLEQNK